jgi:NAD(P)-dependent dehydrogenase (short-subunit alcohol dehydrogenase family)
VILADYNMEKGYQALQQLCLETGCDEKNIRLIECDLRSFDSIRHFVKLYNEEEKRLDVLICNAGIAWAPNLLTNDGFNTVIQVNYLGHFLLTNLLLDKLKNVDLVALLTLLRVRIEVSVSFDISRMFIWNPCVAVRSIDWSDAFTQLKSYRWSNYPVSKAFLLLFSYQLKQDLYSSTSIFSSIIFLYFYI